MPLAALLDERRFSDVPGDWAVVIADVRGSTAAVAAGRHNDVNLVAAGSLVAALNVAKKAEVEVPYFFGGDGGTLLVPLDLREPMLAALRLHRKTSEEAFGLSLHIGAVRVEDVRAGGHNVRLAKACLSTGLHKAVLIGTGLLWAERQVKAAGAEAEIAAAENFMLDMMGLECRWDRIKPPADGAEVVCYLIEACHESEQLGVYRAALREIDAVYGTPERRNPLSLHRLKLLISTAKMRSEMLVRFGRWRWRYFAAESFKTLVARVLLRLRKKAGPFNGATYLDEVIQNADTLTLDGRINTIVSGTAAQRERLLQYLSAEEAAGRLVFGHHAARESVMTCYIQSHEREHVHFVDGSDGGYTAAAGELKSKLLAHA